MKKNIAVVIGTRPGIVKMAMVYRACKKNPDFNVSLIYTGQHYSANLKDVIWSAFDLPEPNFIITGIEDCATHATQISKMMIGCEKVFSENDINTVLVCGDANTNFAAGVAARKLNLKLGHVESGLRSHDWSMPEEHNRVMLDHISDFLFAPTEKSMTCLKAESAFGEKILTGNTVVDALKFVVDNDKHVKPSQFPEVKDFCLVTTHRQENVDDPDRLKKILNSIEKVSREIPVIFPIHPRTRKMIDLFEYGDVVNGENIYVVEPFSYIEMLWVIDNSKVVMSDSGGLQEEACILGTPCVTLRDNTERPEAVDVGANIIAGVEVDKVYSAFQEQIKLANSGEKWINPFGDGRAAEKIAKAIE
jgi:UDP-N-acetylglucosamine 2-epimerase (non-hydrolysing)